MSITDHAGAERTGFPSPFEVTIPPDCEGWEEMYARHVVFGEARRGFEEGRFWFQDGLHAAEPLYPFDSFLFEYAVVAMNQSISRLFVAPTSLGHECRLLNGYIYLSANPVTDEATLERRTELFAERSGHYYEHWNELYEGWLEKVQAATTELAGLDVPEMPEVEDESIVTDGRGLGSSHALLHAYDRLLEGADRIFQYHFEFLLLGYGAYLAFYEQCRERFPDISDQTIAKMVSGIDVLVLRPDEELRRLARLARELGVSQQVESAENEEGLVANLAGSDVGERWLDDFEQTKDPWFYFSCGTGVFHHHHRSWIDDTRLPVQTIGSYISRLDAGEDISRPHEAALAERERITEEYRALLSPELCDAFDESLALARTVFPYVENHHFYIDHRYFTIFWNKVREFGALLARHGLLADGEDVFLLRHDEVRSALEELRLDWSSGGAGVARGPLLWPPLVERRRAIYDAMCEWAPPPALGPPPEEITDPIAVMLWGITDERVRGWLSSDGDGSGTLTGCAASPGVAEGLARVLLRVDQLGELEDDEILVAPVTSPSWTPVFHRIAATVLDTGGIMCHAAIVAREYGLPAVVGTGTGTTAIKTGDRLRVDATTGVVTIVDRAPA
jgi:phosphohistidine swiveling domain-containing protein